jgi:hypothetical protein
VSSDPAGRETTVADQSGDARAARASAAGVGSPDWRQGVGDVSLAALVFGGVAVAVGGGARQVAGGIPRWALGPLAGLGLHLTAARQHLVIAGMVVAYGALVACVRALRRAWVVGSIVVLFVAFALAPPLLSSDLYNYVDFGRLGVVHHLDPYTFAPDAAPHDPLVLVVQAEEHSPVGGAQARLGRARERRVVQAA